MSTFLLFTLALAVTGALAAPTPCCDISDVQLALPADNRTAFSTPTSSLSSLVLGVGVQNYTCSSAGIYKSTGAVASLYDLACISQVPEFNDIQDLVYNVWKASPTSAKLPMTTSFMGNHFFITSPSGLSPVWDYRAGAAKGNPDAFVLAAKVADVPAPTSPQDNVDWLQLKSVSGSLATQIYRTDTRGGSPPTSCTPGSAPISLKYVAKYWLYGGNVTLTI
jgi:hypothetical protein